MRAPISPETAAAPDHPGTHDRYFARDRLREVRERAGLTRRQTAEALREQARMLDLSDVGCDARRVALWEEGREFPSAWELIALATIYRVTTDAFTDCADCALARRTPQGSAAA